MPIPREYATSNPVVRDALGRIPLPTGSYTGDFVAPDYPVDAEIVDDVTVAQHALNLDDLRAPDAEAKEIRFETGTITTLSVVERALKTKIDSRKIDEAGYRGVDVVAERLAMLRQDIMDAKEYRIAQAAFTAANFSGTHKDITGLNFRTSDLSKLVDGWQETIIQDGYFQAQYAVLGRRVWQYVRSNDIFRKYTAAFNIQAGSQDETLAKLAEYLGLKEVRLADFRRKIGTGTTATQFWTADSFLLFCKQPSLSNRTFAGTPVVPYGPNNSGDDPGQSTPNGALVDARTDQLSGTERLTEIGAYHRYRTYVLNANLAFLVTGVVGT